MTVPWFVVDGNEHRSITPSETTVPVATGDETSVEDRLADLGYREE